MNYKNKINKGYSLIEVIIAVTLFTILFSAEIFGVYTILKLEIKTKNRIYKVIEDIEIISKEYYIKHEEKN